MFFCQHSFNCINYNYPLNIINNFFFRLDVAYYDGLSETILSVGLVKPKPGIFQNYIRHLLVLTTTVEIVVLGVTFSVGNKSKCAL